jgi:hypothetical protein
MRFESSIEINAPATKVWALVDRLERTSKEPLTVGSKLFVTAKVVG